jgi:NDMA-dependent alcohol dehydrogenase
VQTQAAIMWEPGQQWSVETIELDPPKAHEVLVELTASGMCHSDDHIRTQDMPAMTPIIGGHEGAGIVREVGPGVETLKPGDHVVFGFIPSCGQCPSCSTGHQNLCDLGAALLMGLQIDGTARHHAQGKDLYTMVCLGTFGKHSVVHEWSCIKIDEDIPLELACLVGCGVTTGWGSAVYAGDVQPGDDVVVLGIGGIGANAVQGARLAGAGRIFAIDPVEFKREQAKKFGATHTYASMDEAFEEIQQETRGRMAHKAICTIGVGDGALIPQVMTLIAKRGTVVITNIHAASETEIGISLLDLTLMEKRMVGSLFGSANPRFDIPKLLELYRQGQLELEGLVTRSYDLTDINQGYADMLGGKNIRGRLDYTV